MPWHENRAVPKSTRSGRDSGTKTALSHGESPESGRQRKYRNQLNKKAPGHRIPHRESLGLSPRFPWDTSVFVPEFPSPAVLRRAAQALRPPHCYANRCARIKEACVRQITRSLSLRLIRARTRLTIPLAWAKKGANDPFRHRIKRINTRRDSRRAKRPMREWDS